MMFPRNGKKGVSCENIGRGRTRGSPTAVSRTFALGRLVYATGRGRRAAGPRPVSSHVLLLLMLRLMVLRPLAFGLRRAHAVLGPVLGGSAHLHQEIGRDEASDSVALAPVETVVVHLAVDEYGLTHFEV